MNFRLTGVAFATVLLVGCASAPNMNFRLTGVAFATVLLVGCASAPDKDPQGRSDPLEGFNRTMFDFNYNVTILISCARSRWHGATTCRCRRVTASATSPPTGRAGQHGQRLPEGRSLPRDDPLQPFLPEYPARDGRPYRRGRHGQPETGARRTEPLRQHAGPLRCGLRPVRDVAGLRQLHAA